MKQDRRATAEADKEAIRSMRPFALDQSKLYFLRNKGEVGQSSEVA